MAVTTTSCEGRDTKMFPLNYVTSRVTRPTRRIDVIGVAERLEKGGEHGKRRRNRFSALFGFCASFVSLNDTSDDAHGVKLARE